MYNQLDVVMFH